MRIYEKRNGNKIKSLSYEWRFKKNNGDKKKKKIIEISVLKDMFK